jgi:4-diphosphocytidyl-2-C-methyl-D-erythritol kinase
MTLVLPAPAKLNLFLHITGRRHDGYHELQTVFQLLDYGDELRFTTRRDGTIHLSPDFPGIPLEENLIYRAARALQDATNCSLGADISVIKRLPSGGGLGGGSSDAATTLLALNRIWDLNLPTAELAELGLRLGADVPVFVGGHSAWAEGIGEQLTPVSLKDGWYLVITPNCHVNTGKIFCSEELTRNDLPITIRAFLRAGPDLALQNTCLPVVESLYPSVKEARLWLNRFAEASMSGTGASVFARFSAEEQARQVFAQLPDTWQGFVARAVNKSPVHEALGLD